MARQFGSPEWPLSREEHLAKARACLALGGMAAAYDALLPVLVGVEGEADAMAAIAFNTAAG